MGIKVVPTKGKSPKKQPSKKMESKVSIAGPVIKSEADWQAEEDVRTLMRAEEIKANAARFAKAKAEAKKQINRAAKAIK